MSLPPGTRLGAYEINSLIGAGGMGEVYRAHDTRLDRDVAIKVLGPHLSLNPAALARFQREAKAVAALSHPNILSIHDFAVDEGRPYAVTELLTGETLRERLTAGALPVRKALEYGVQLAEGLAAAHEKGLVHRDIKPENVFVTTDDRVKILDFGLVRHEPTMGADSLTFSAPTIEGTLLGTVAYMSPEQAAGKAVDFRSDQFSLGLVLYEMLTATRAFAGPSTAETLAAIIRDEPAPLSAFNQSVPAPLRWIVERCLAKDPGGRYASTHDLARELRTLLDHLPETTPSAGTTRTAPAPAPAATGPRRSIRHWNAVAGIAVAVVLIAAMAALYFRATRTERASIDSLAVLPLANGSGDPETEYLSDGVTEVLINNLSQLPQLKVLARQTVFRYKGTGDPIKAARELGVRALLTGKITQRGEMLTIQAELVDVDSGVQLWGDRYNRRLADVVSVQEEIARSISETLRPRFTGERPQLNRYSSGDPEAYRLYLRGRFHWNKLTEEDIRKSIDYFKQALARDPRYALAYAGLGDAYELLGQIGRPPRENAGSAKAAADKALELDKNLPEAHILRGAHELFYGWNWAIAEQELKRAMDLKHAPAHDLYGQFLYATGRSEEGIGEIRKALDVDPLSPLTNSNLAQAYYLTRQYEKAIEQARSTLALDSQFFLASLYIGSSYGQLRDYQRAITELLKTRTLPGGFAAGTGELGYVYGVSGQRRQSEEMLTVLRNLASRTYVDPYYVAIVYAGLPDRDRTFAALEKAYEDRSYWLLYSNVDPKFDHLRSDSRFVALQQRLNLPSRLTTRK